VAGAATLIVLAGCSNELPLDGTVSTVVTIDVPAGTYDELESEVDKPVDDADDVAFLQDHSEFEGVSIRVEGTFNGNPFVFTQDLNEESWFMTSGGTLVDPDTAGHGGANGALVEANIRRSIDAFVDHDEDGEHDD